MSNLFPPITQVKSLEVTPESSHFLSTHHQPTGRDRWVCSAHVHHPCHSHIGGHHVLLTWMDNSSSLLVSLLPISALLSILNTGSRVTTVSHKSNDAALPCHGSSLQDKVRRPHDGPKPSPQLSLGSHFLPPFPLLSSSYWPWDSLMNKQAHTRGLCLSWPQPGSPFSLIPTWPSPRFNQVSPQKHLFTVSSLTAVLKM